MRNIECSKAEELILAHLDEGLQNKKRLVLENHLLNCASCRELYPEIQLLLTDLAADKPEDPGEAFWRYYNTSLEARLADRNASRSWNFWLKPAGAFAIVILVAIISLSVFDLWNFHSLMIGPTTSPTPSAQLISDLNQLYGPVPDEVAFSSIDAEHLQYSQSSRFTDDSLVEWFEVEDEPNQFFL